MVGGTVHAGGSRGFVLDAPRPSTWLARSAMLCRGTKALPTAERGCFVSSFRARLPSNSSGCDMPLRRCRSAMFFFWVDLVRILGGRLRHRHDFTVLRLSASISSLKQSHLQYLVTARRQILEDHEIAGDVDVLLKWPLLQCRQSVAVAQPLGRSDVCMDRSRRWDERQRDGSTSAYYKVEHFGFESRMNRDPFLAPDGVADAACHSRHCAQLPAHMGIYTEYRVLFTEVRGMVTA
jgi:hypothetical protein